MVWPIAHWRLNNNASDSVGTNHGTITGATATDAGKIVGAYYFDGINAYDRIRCQSSVPFTQGTLSFWIKGLIGAGNQRAQNIYPVGWESKLSILGPAGGITERSGIITSSGGVERYYNWGDQNIYDNNWHHYVVSWDDTYVYLWLDGNLIEPAKIHVGEFGNITTNYFDIGCGWSTGYGPHTGLIDDVRIYDKALSTAEVADIYNAGIGTESDYLHAIRLGDTIIYSK